MLNTWYKFPYWKQQHNLNPVIHILKFIFIFLKILFIYLTERERAAEGEGEADFPAEQGAQCGTQSQDPGIMTWAKGRRLIHWATQALLTQAFNKIIYLWGRLGGSVG